MREPSTTPPTRPAAAVATPAATGTAFEVAFLAFASPPLLLLFEEPEEDRPDEDRLFEPVLRAFELLLRLFEPPLRALELLGRLFVLAFARELDALVEPDLLFDDLLADALLRDPLGLEPFELFDDELRLLVDRALDWAITPP
jgi:hypothetical protein